MNLHYDYKKESNSTYFSYDDNKIGLRQYIPQLIFYHPFINDRAEFAYYDKLPYILGRKAMRDHGAFGTCMDVFEPIRYDNKNFDLLKEYGTISFRCGINTIEGYSSQTIFLDKWEENNEESDYSFTIKVGRESVKPVIFHLAANATKSDVFNTILASVDPATFKAEVDLADLNNIKILGAYQGERVVLSQGSSGIDLLSILDVGDNIFGCYPKTEQNILSFSNPDNKYNINFIHQNINSTSMLKVEMYNEKELITTLTSRWENDNSYLSAIELGWDYDVAYLFIDGELKDFQKTDFNRDVGGILTIYGSDEYPYTFDELIVTSNLTHTASFNVEQNALTKYTTTRPYIDFFWKGTDLTNEALNQLIIQSTPNIHFILYYNNMAYYYLSGSWRESDGTFSKSNDISTFIAKIGEFVFNGSQIQIRAIFDSDGNSPAYIEDIYFELNDDSVFGDEAEAPAILTGIPQLNEPIDLYGKTLTIITDQGTTEIEFTGDLHIEKQDDCANCPCNVSIVKIKVEDEDTFKTVVELVKEVHLESHIILTSNLAITNKLIVEKDAILDTNGFALTGINTKTELIVKEGASVTSLNVGTYIWNINKWKRVE